MGRISGSVISNSPTAGEIEALTVLLRSHAYASTGGDAPSLQSMRRRLAPRDTERERVTDLHQVLTAMPNINGITWLSDEEKALLDAEFPGKVNLITAATDGNGDATFVLCPLGVRVARMHPSPRFAMKDRT